MHSEDKLLDQVRRRITDEEVIAAGWFEPFGRVLAEGTAGSVMGIGGLGALGSSAVVDAVAATTTAVGAGAAAEVMAQASHAPAAVILAVTPTKLYAFDANPLVPTATVKDLWQVWDRDAIHVHGSKVLYALLMTVEDPRTGQAIQWQGSKTHLEGPKHVLRELLTS